MVSWWPQDACCYFLSPPHPTPIPIVLLCTMPWTLGSMAAQQPMDSNCNPPSYEQSMEGQPDNLQTRTPIHLA